MVYKRAKKGPATQGKTRGANGTAQFKNKAKIGEATAKRMHEKLGRLRKAKQDEEDEVKSNDSDAYIDREPVNASHSKRKELMNDPFL